MNYLFLLMGFIALIACSFFIERFLSESLKRYSFMTAISVIGIFLYWMTFTINFFYAQYFIYGFAVFVLLQEAIKNKCQKFKVFYFDHQPFFILSLVWFFLTFKVQILQWDDFSWGSFVKHLNHFGAYWNFDAAILEQGLRYFPGLSLWENFFTGRDIYSEQPLFFALGLIFIACFQALKPLSFTGKKTAWLFLFFCAPLSWFTNGIGTISVEASMAFLLATGIIATFDVKKPADLFIPFVIALFLAVTKETGFILSLLIILVIAIKTIREKIFFSQWTLFAILALGIILLNYELWQRFLKLDNRILAFNSSYVLDLLKSDINSLSQRSEDTLKTFFTALYDRPIARSFLSRIPIPGFIFIKGFYLFWMTILVFIIFQVRKNYEYIVTYFWGLIGYTLVLVVTFLYVFSDYEGRYLASYERYMGLYFLAFSLVCIKIILENNLWSNKTFKVLFISLIVIFPPSPKVLHPASLKNLISFVKKTPVKMERQEVEEVKSNIIRLTPIDSKIWLIWQNSNGIQAMMVRYEIAPRKMNVSAWSLGNRYNEGDVWTLNYTIDEILAQLEKYDYMALGSIDENFIQKYGTLFTSTPRVNGIYKKEITDGSIRLREIL